MKQKFIVVVKYLNQNKIFILSASIYWIIIVFSTIFFILIGFNADSYLTLYIYETFAICTAVSGVLIYRYFIGLLNSKDEILLTLNIVTISVILLSIPGSFILMAIGAQLIERLPNFRTFGNEGDWINFIGIIIAGTITMLGITYTIKNEQKSRENDRKNTDMELAISSTPVVIFEIDEKFAKKSRHYKMIKTEQSSIGLELESDFYIKNTSNHFAIVQDFKLDSIEIIDTIFDDKSVISTENVSSYSFEIGDIIPPNTSLSVRFNLNCIANDFNLIVFKYKLIYSDFMNVNKYSIDAEFSTYIEIVDNETIQNYYAEGEGIYLEHNQFLIEVKYGSFENKFRKL